MTALQVAKQECANCDSAGNCAGVGIRDDGSLYRFRREREKCWLAPGPDGAIARCPYFEECVAPAANERLRNAATAEQRIRAKSFADGVRIMIDNIEYWSDAPVWTVDRIAEATSDWFLHLGAAR